MTGAEQRQNLLESIADFIRENDRGTYGDFTQNMTAAENIGSLLLGDTDHNAAFAAAMRLHILKLVRICHGEFKHDNYVDAINYLTKCYEEDHKYTLDQAESENATPSLFQRIVQ